MRAIVVFPVPGGPQRMKEKRCCFSIATRSGFPGPTKCSCPTTPSRVSGRILAASGSIVTSVLFTVRYEQVSPMKTRPVFNSMQEHSWYEHDNNKEYPIERAMQKGARRPSPKQAKEAMTESAPLD